MSAVIEAVYEKGVFRPTGAVPALPEGASVTLTVQPRPAQPANAADEAAPSWDELRSDVEKALRPDRDPEVMRQAAERMDRMREELFQRHGLLNLAVPLVRESRDEE